MNIGPFVDGKAQQPLPPAFATHEPELDQFQKYCHGMMMKILTLFAIGLKVNTLSPNLLPYFNTSLTHFRSTLHLVAPPGFVHFSS
jgi:isopenicillin N synthase-like dioxygenase